MNRVKLRSLFSTAEWRSIEGAQQQSAALFMESCSFHSTAALDRKRKNQWHYNFNYYGKRKRNRNRESKRALFGNISDYAEFLFQSWREEEQRNAAKRPSWFRGHHWVRGTNRTHGFNPHGFHNSPNFSRNYGQDDFDSDLSDDEGPETVFRSTFGGGRFYWSFRWGGSTPHTSYDSRRWSYYSDEEDDDDERFRTSKSISEMASARQTLGLSVSGPLKIEEVKTAYRTCALRWHPDRHHGSSKVEAEERFKHCSAAYKTLCDRLA